MGEPLGVRTADAVPVPVGLCEIGVDDIDGVTDAVGVLEGVWLGVALRVGERVGDREREAERDLDRVSDGVAKAVPVCDTVSVVVTDADADTEDVRDSV